MAKYFNDEFVKWTYRIENHGAQDPSGNELRSMDTAMYNRVKTHLKQQMTDHGLDWTARNRSLVTMLTFASSGTGKTRVKRACQYWSNVMGKTLRGTEGRHDWGA